MPSDERRERDRPPLRDRAPREPPRERQRPHPPELRPRARAAPDVARPFEPERGRRSRSAARRAPPRRPPTAPGRRAFRRSTRRSARCTAAGRATTGTCRAPSDRGRGARQDVRQALVVVEARRAEREVGVPPVERQVSVADPLRGPADHRPMDPGVVQEPDVEQLGAERPEAEPDGDAHQQERQAPRRARRLGHAAAVDRARRARSDRRPSGGRCRSGRSAPSSSRPRGS